MTVGSAYPAGAARPVGDSTAGRDRSRGDRTAPRLVDRFELHVIEEPEALAVAEGAETVVRAELWLAAGLAAGEIRSAVGSGKRVVVVHLPDSAAWLVMFLAVLRAGHIPARLPVAATAQDWLHVFERVEPAMVISAAQSSEDMPAPAVLEAASRTPGVSVALAEGTAVHIHHRAEGSPKSVSVPEDVLLVAFTLSETGPPEALMHSEESVAAQNRYLTERYAPSRHAPVLVPCPHEDGKTIVDAACLSMYAGAPIVIRDASGMGALKQADHEM
ncbi:MAG: AMP-binding protein [Acidimicrobiaceae bacterium]|nr:AMP-binding protein [Acidimicrobiaceae bacterium]